MSGESGQQLGPLPRCSYVPSPVFVIYTAPEIPQDILRWDHQLESHTLATATEPGCSADALGTDPELEPQPRPLCGSGTGCVCSLSLLLQGRTPLLGGRLCFLVAAPFSLALCLDTAPDTLPSSVPSPGTGPVLGLSHHRSAVSRGLAAGGVCGPFGPLVGHLWTECFIEQGICPLFKGKK